MNSTQIYLIRHAQSQGNAHFESGLGRLPPTELGSDLTLQGVTQAQQLAQELHKVPFDLVYSSPLLRAKHTAEILLGRRGVSLILDEQLRERQQEAESDVVAAARFMKKLQELSAAHSAKVIAVVTHGFVIRSFLAETGLIKKEILTPGSVQNASYIKLEFLDKNFSILETKRIGDR